jgi:hypothetical protein
MDKFTPIPDSNEEMIFKTREAIVNRITLVQIEIYKVSGQAAPTSRISPAANAIIELAYADRFIEAESAIVAFLAMYAHYLKK